MGRRPNLERRLTEVRAEVGRLREGLAVLEAQLAHAVDVSADAMTRALVEEGPPAQRERKRAESDERRVRRQRDETATRLAQLSAESDDLLERMFSGSKPETSG